MARSKVGDAVVSLGDHLREQRTSAQLSLRQLAAQAGVSNPYLSQIERGLRRPSAEVLQQLAKALRVSAESLYVHAGIVAPGQGEARSVELAVLGDPDLTERQKQTLLDVYSSFRGANLAERPTLPSTSETTDHAGTTPVDSSTPPPTEVSTQKEPHHG